MIALKTIVYKQVMKLDWERTDHIQETKCIPHKLTLK